VTPPIASLFLPLQHPLTRQIHISFNPTAMDPRNEPIFAQTVMALGYPRVGILPPEPELDYRVLDDDEPLPRPVSRPVIWAQASGRKRRRR
jgi:hypothetical protein